jgi:hypothetical protein
MTPSPPVWNLATRIARSLASEPLHARLSFDNPSGNVARSRSA